MKSNLLPIILGLFIVPCLAQTSVSTNQPTLDNQTQISQTSSSEQQESPILSSDYKIAKQSLDKAISERDEAIIRLGLNASSAQLRRDVYQAIANLYYQWFVPDLIKALEENQTLTNEEIKTRSEQKKVNESLISALQNLTGLGFFPNEKFLPAEEFLEIRNKSLQWYETHEKQIEEAMQKERLMMKQEISILSKYYYLAERAFKKAVLERDTETIRLGLKSQFLSIKREVTLVIRQLGNKSFVPDLITALERNQGIIGGGSEIQSEQNQLNKEIVLALEQLTNLKFPYCPTSLISLCPYSTGCVVDRIPNEIQRVLEECRKWWEAYQKENNL